MLIGEALKIERALQGTASYKTKMEVPFHGKEESNPQWLCPHVKLSILPPLLLSKKFLTQLLNETDVKKVEPVTLFVDNQSTVAIAKDPIRNQRTKHIDIKYHFIRSEIKNGSIAMNSVPSEENMAVVFTKPMKKGNLQLF